MKASLVIFLLIASFSVKGQAYEQQYNHFDSLYKVQGRMYDTANLFRRVDIIIEQRRLLDSMDKYAKLWEANNKATKDDMLLLMEFQREVARFAGADSAKVIKRYQRFYKTPKKKKRS